MFTDSGPVLGSAFADPVMDSQQAFRTIMTAMSEPGTIHRLDVGFDCPPNVAAATMGVLLTLADHDTPVWFDGDGHDSAMEYLRFHTGAPLAACKQDATFAVLTKAIDAADLKAFQVGNNRYPDRSATVIVEAQSLTRGTPRIWSGPGIEGSRRVAADVTLRDFWAEIATNHSRYPLGIDLFLVAGHELMALPRSTRVTKAGEAR